MFLKGAFPLITKIATVDLNPDIVQVGADYLGFAEDDKIVSIVDDALTYISGHESDKIDLLILDINYEEKDLSLSPPAAFLEPEFIQ